MSELEARTDKSEQLGLCGWCDDPVLDDQSHVTAFPSGCTCTPLAITKRLKRLQTTNRNTTKGRKIDVHRGSK
jgi:hypothetical protein